MDIEEQFKYEKLQIEEAANQNPDEEQEQQQSQDEQENPDMQDEVSDNNDDEEENIGIINQQQQDGSKDGLEPKFIKPRLQVRQEDNNKKKRKKGRKKKKVEEKEPDTDYEADWQSKIKDSKILEDQHLPQEVKEKYAYMENNPYLMIISNVPNNINMKGLEEYFNTLIVSLNPKITDKKPVKSLEFGVLKSWIILEARTKEAKQTLSPLEQLEYINCKLKVEKPRKFLNRVLNLNKDALNADIKKYEQIRLYMGGIPLFLNEDDIRKLIQTFGPVSYFNLVKDTSNQQQPMSRGYCFFEYESASSATKALKALNGLQIADKKLKVNKVQLPQKVDRGDKEPSNYAGSFLASCDLLRIPEVQMMLSIPQCATIASKVVQFLNMVSPEDLFDDDIYAELQSELRSECSIYGNVDKVEIPRPDQETGYCSPAVGKCFVKFFYQIPAKKCKHHLGGRTYNKRTVITSFYPEEKFDLKDYLING